MLAKSKMLAAAIAVAVLVVVLVFAFGQRLDSGGLAGSSPEPPDTSGEDERTPARVTATRAASEPEPPTVAESPDSSKKGRRPLKPAEREFALSELRRSIDSAKRNAEELRGKQLPDVELEQCGALREQLVLERDVLLYLRAYELLNAGGGEMVDRSVDINQALAGAHSWFLSWQDPGDADQGILVSLPTRDPVATDMEGKILAYRKAEQGIVLAMFNERALSERQDALACLNNGDNSKMGFDAKYLHVVMIDKERAVLLPRRL